MELIINTMLIIIINIPPNIVCFNISIPNTNKPIITVKKNNDIRAIIG